MKTISWWIFDYVLKPLAFVFILLGIKVTLTDFNDKKVTYNAKGEKWKWLNLKN